MRRLAATFASLAAFVLAGRLALGQPSSAELAPAREAYRAGIALEVAADWSGALQKFQEVAAVKPTAQVRFHIGLCEEKLGKWTAALGAYQLAIAEADKSGASDAMREAVAAQDALQAQIPKLILRRGDGAQAASISLDGVALGETAVGKPLLVDPGPHNVDAFVSGERRFSKVVTLSAQETRTFVVTVDMPKPATAVATSPAEPRADRPLTPPAKRGVLPFVLLGVGAVGLGAAGVFWVLRQNTVKDLEQGCVGSRCPPSLQPTFDRGRIYNDVAIGALAVGGAALLTGTYLLLTFRPTARRTPVSMRITPAVSGLRAEAAF